MIKKKQGISLIVLVITIIVMIILAGTVVITLSNTGIIGKAEETVDENNLKQLQSVASLAWSEAYIDSRTDKTVNIADRVYAELEKYGVKRENDPKYEVTIDETGVIIKEKYTGSTLGSLITNPKDDYGKTVDYSVTIGDTTYTDWQILYHTEDYVYLIKTEKLKDKVRLDKGITVESLSTITVETLPEGKNTLLDLYDIFRVGDAPKYKLDDKVNGKKANSSQAIAQLITDYLDFGKPTASYKKYVVGAIGGLTLELLTAGWNVKEYTPQLLPLTIDSYGYYMNGVSYANVAADGLYVPTDYCWLAVPSANGLDQLLVAGDGLIGTASYTVNPYNIRPVVCLKANVPATVGTGEYNFILGE